MHFNGILDIALKLCALCSVQFNGCTMAMGCYVSIVKAAQWQRIAPCSESWCIIVLNYIVVHSTAAEDSSGICGIKTDPLFQGLTPECILYTLSFFCWNYEMLSMMRKMAAAESVAKSQLWVFNQQQFAAQCLLPAITSPISNEPSTVEYLTITAPTTGNAGNAGNIRNTGSQSI